MCLFLIIILTVEVTHSHYEAAIKCQLRARVPRYYLQNHQSRFETKPKYIIVVNTEKIHVFASHQHIFNRLSQLCCVNIKCFFENST